MEHELSSEQLKFWDVRVYSIDGFEGLWYLNELLDWRADFEAWPLARVEITCPEEEYRPRF